jgi:hypothetical protein
MPLVVLMLILAAIFGNGHHTYVGGTWTGCIATAYGGAVARRRGCTGAMAVASAAARSKPSQLVARAANISLVSATSALRLLRGMITGGIKMFPGLGAYLYEDRLANRLAVYRWMLRPSTLFRAQGSGAGVVGFILMLGTIVTVLTAVGHNLTRMQRLLLLD